MGLSLRRFPNLLVGRALLCALATVVTAHAEMRVWTDIEGRTLRAELMETRGDGVVMRREDGLVFNLPLQRLSAGDREFVARWKPAPLKVPTVEEAVLLINTPFSRGSGFLAQDNGRAYAYTNQHVIAGAPLDKIRIVTTAGKVLVPDAIEVIPTADMARLRVDVTEGLLIGDPARLEDKIAVYGNSQGAGVTTLSRGKVLGAAVDRLEISSEIVPGNSGGPVLNEAGEVVGISTYVSMETAGEENSKRSWTLKNTRYEKPRRFALRLQRGMDWQAQVPAAYVAQAGKVADLENLVDEGWELAERLVTKPDSGVPSSVASDDRFREVIGQQNDMERKLSRTSLSSFNSIDDMARFNESLNQAYRRRLTMIGDILERVAENGRRSPPRLELPYHIEKYDRAAERAKHLAEELDRIRERTVPFVTGR